MPDRHISYTGFIASRYLKSRHNDGFISFITTIAITGVALGTAALIIALAVLGGFEKEITDKIVGFTSHVQVTGFQNAPLRNHAGNAALIEKEFPVVKAVAPFVAREALIRSSTNIDGILLKGVDPARDLSITPRYIVAGQYDLRRDPGSTAKLVIGKKLADRLAVGIGDRVAVFGMGRTFEPGQLRVTQFRVTGLYESGMAEYDDIYAFTGLADAQTLFQMGDAVSGYDVDLWHADSAFSVAAAIQERLGYPHYAKTVFQNYRNIFAWIELQKQPVPIVLGLIIVVATVNIVGTLLMMVLSKTREIGVLRAMGARKRDIARIFLRQGFVIAFIGTSAGNLLAYGLCQAQLELQLLTLPSDIYFMASVPILIKWEYFIIVSAISITLCMLSSLVPARLAARVTPVAAIRFM